MATSRRLAPFAIAGLAVLVLAACGGDSSANDVPALTPTFAGPTATLVTGVHSVSGSTSSPAGQSSATGNATPGSSPAAAGSTPGAGSSPAVTGQGSTPSGSPAATQPSAASGSSSRVVARMSIPSLGVNYPIEQLGLVPGRNQLDTPHNALGAIGWYSIYDAPGAGSNAVFSAHINYNGSNGPFAQLSHLPAGAEVVTTMTDGIEYRYQVFSNRRYVINEAYANASYPLINMDEVLWPSARPGGEEWVTLITCSCEPGRIVNQNAQGFGDCVDRDVVIARRLQ